MRASSRRTITRLRNWRRSRTTATRNLRRRLRNRPRPEHRKGTVADGRLQSDQQSDQPHDRIVSRDRRSVFTPSTRGRPFVAFRAGGSGDVTGKNEIWTNNLGADVPTPTTDGKYIYILVDNGVLNCVEALTGKVVYQGQRIENGTYSASPLLADGKIHCTSEDGTTTIVKAGSEFEILGTNKLEGLTLASPMAVDSQIFIRTADYLYCIQ